MRTRHEQTLTAIRTHSRVIVAGLILAAIVLRILLAVDCPTPFGYVFDYYHEGVELLFTTGRLPLAADCWQCYHPPLYYLLGLPFYAAGVWLAHGSDAAGDWGLRGLTGLALVAGAITAWYSVRLARWLHRDRALSVIATALVLSFPCLFISSYGPDADIVLAAVMSAFLFHLTTLTTRRDGGTWKHAAVVGLLAGLAAATKYSGLAALATAGVVLALRLVTDESRGRIIRNGLLILAVAVAVGGWKYADNARRYGSALFANGSAGDALSLHREDFFERYDFWSFHPQAIIEASAPGGPGGRLTALPVYRSVWTTLYGMAWGDLSFFSVPGRIEDPTNPYPARRIPGWLIGAVVYLALVPTPLAGVGLVVTLRRRAYLPILVLLVVTLTSYFWWVVGQDEWALKTKYLLFLLPGFVTYALAGLRAIIRRCPAPLTVAIGVLLVVLVAAAHTYELAFARGHL